MAMAVTKSLLIGLTFASCVFAADCSTSGTTTISASADATALASCTTYSGSVAIQTGLSTPTDTNGHQQIQVDNLQKIDGNLTITSVAALAEITFGSLQVINGTCLMSFLSGLASVNMPALVSVKQLNLTALPVLQMLNFGTVGITKAQSILITNTGLSSLDGLNNLESVDSMDINNNQALQNITMKKVTSISNSLSIVDNNGLTTGLNVDFPLLQTAQNITFRNCSDINLPALANVTDDLGFYGNDITSVSAENLTTLRSLILDNNAQLTNASFPSLSSINGSCTITENTLLNKIDGFPVLEAIGGALVFSGNFTEVDLPELTQVRGAFNLTSSGPLDCSAFVKLNNNKAIKGKFQCTSNIPNPSATTTGGKASKTGSAIHFEANMPIILSASSVVATFLLFFL